MSKVVINIDKYLPRKPRVPPPDHPFTIVLRDVCDDLRARRVPGVPKSVVVHYCATPAVFNREHSHLRFRTDNYWRSITDSRTVATAYTNTRTGQHLMLNVKEAEQFPASPEYLATHEMLHLCITSFAHRQHAALAALYCELLAARETVADLLTTNLPDDGNHRMLAGEDVGEHACILLHHALDYPTEPLGEFGRRVWQAVLPQVRWNALPRRF